MGVTGGNPSIFGQSVTLTATVSPSGATGKATFYKGTSVLGIGTLTGGVAQLRTSLIPAGSGTVTAYYGGDTSYAPSTSGSAVLRVSANPSGTLLPVTASPIAIGLVDPLSVAVGDFNGDGIQDFAVVSNDVGNNVSVFLGNGSGGFSFAPGSPFAAGTRGTLPDSVAVGDFNGDGIPDLAVIYSLSSNVTILLGTGSGAFNPALGSPFPAGGGNYGIAIGDFNRDGIEDLAFNNGVILLGNGAGGFGPAPGSPLAGVGGQSITLGDFNGDGIPDLVIGSFIANTVVIMLGDGSGGFRPTAASPISVGSEARSPVVGDFNADGIQDLAIADDTGNPASSIIVLLGDGHGGFSPAPRSPFAGGLYPKSIAVGDLNGDGIQDLAIASDFPGHGVTVLLGDGSAGFSPAPGGTFDNETYHNSVAIGDFNGDGRADLVTTWDMGNVSILPGASAPTDSLLSTASPASIPFGTSVPLTLTASDTGTPFNAPTGTAAFYDGSTILGTATQTTSPYTFNATGLAEGSHTLTATYSGDARSSASTSNSVTIAVTSGTPIISGLSPLSATAGGPAFTLTINGQGFAPGVFVQWNGAALTTAFVSSAQLTALVTANLIIAAGTASVTVVNPGGATSGAASFTVTPGPQLSITGNSPPSGILNIPYGPFTFTASGGSGAYLWSVRGVPGVTVNSMTGVLSGTPTSSGILTLTVTLTDANSLAFSISRSYSVTITTENLTIITSALPSGIQNRAYSASLAGNGGSGSYNWMISGIAGLTVNAGTGAIGGTPTVGGNLTLTVTLSDVLNPGATPAVRQITVAIALATLTITTPTNLGKFAPNAAMQRKFAAAGGSPAFTWSATGIPATLTLNPATGQITGNTPANPGNYSFIVSVRDSETPVASDSATVTFSVLAITPARHPKR